MLILFIVVAMVARWFWLCVSCGFRRLVSFMVLTSISCLAGRGLSWFRWVVCLCSWVVLVVW